MLKEGWVLREEKEWGCWEGSKGRRAEERKGKERKGKERKGKERKGKERKGRVLRKGRTEEDGIR